MTAQGGGGASAAKMPPQTPGRDVVVHMGYALRDAGLPQDSRKAGNAVLAIRCLAKIAYIAFFGIAVDRGEMR